MSCRSLHTDFAYVAPWQQEKRNTAKQDYSKGQREG